MHESELPVRGGTGFTIEASAVGQAAARWPRPTSRPARTAWPSCATRRTGATATRSSRCTNCGPRFTIITALPYDRAGTTMAGFAMCDACRREYDDPGDRRFHAQPIACHDCGPDLGSTGSACAATGEDALRAARQLLAEGRIVAVKGLGGYHLACDARNEAAVAELRRRKRRGDKPFAVMARDLDVARSLVTSTRTRSGCSPASGGPIVLLPRLCQTRGPAMPTTADDSVAGAVAPGNPDLGVMLPYTPLHVLLFGVGTTAGPGRAGDDVGQPGRRADRHRRRRGRATARRLADAWLRHDRRIHVPCDDSVVPVRRRRRAAGAPLARLRAAAASRCPSRSTPVLAVGADLKNTCAVAAGRYAWLSQHIGDMDDLATLDALTASERTWRS